MIVRNTIIAIAIAFCINHSALAEKDTRPPLDAFQGDALYMMTMCKLTFRLAQSQAEAYSVGAEVNDPEKGDYNACIRNALDDIKPAYKKASSSMKSRAKKEALKSYYAAWISAIRGIAPKSDEIRLVYQKRIADQEDRLNELWAKVEVED